MMAIIDDLCKLRRGEGADGGHAAHDAHEGQRWHDLDPHRQA
jgi:hypothetical protein